MTTEGNAETPRLRSLAAGLSRRALVVYSCLLRSLLDGIGEAILLVDDQGEILFHNRQFDELARVGPSQRLERTGVRTAFAALGATLDESQLQALLESSQTPTAIELSQERTVLCNAVALTLDAPGDCRALVFRDITAEHRELEELERRAFHDQLTGIPNRDLLVDRLERALSRQAREGGGVGVVFIDLDGFKTINDRYGHTTGDRILVEVATRLQLELREADSVGRLGGDEFVVICDALDDEPALARICSRIQDNVEKPYQLDGEMVTLRTSLGGVLAWEHDGAPRELIDRADGLMYTAKRTGSPREIAVEGQPAEVVRRARGVRALREAFEADQLTLACLPVIALDSERITAVEALLRSPHPELSELAPPELLELVEQTRLIHRLNRWVLGEAARAARVLREAPMRALGVVVNLSAVQLADPAIPEIVAEVAGLARIETRSLGFDLRHELVAANLPWLESAIASLRELDCPMFVDDVTAAKVDAERIAALGFAGLKLDPTLIDRCTDDPDVAAATQATVVLAHSLSLSVTGEGIDSDRRLQAVRGLGCDTAQGYGFYGFPRPITELAELIS